MTALLRIKPTNVVPPGNYRFTHEDGVTTSANNKEEWLAVTRRHRERNGYPIPADFDAQAEDQLCRTLPAGWCRWDDGTSFQTPISTHLDLHSIIRGGKVLIEYLKQGQPLVPQEVAEDRARICVGCYLNVEATGCAPCLGLANVVATATGGRKTKADGLLKYCAVCHCVNRAQVHFRIEELAHGVDVQDFVGKAPSWCWKRQELEKMQP